MGVEAITKVLKLFVRAINDGTNKAGSDSAIDRLSDFGNLIPDVIAVLSSVKNLPAELKDLDLSESSQLINQVASTLDLPGERADQVIKVGAEAYNIAVPAVVQAIQLFAGSVRDAKDSASKPA